MTSHNGILLVLSSLATDALYTVDPATGVATLLIELSGHSGNPAGMTSHNGILYMVDNDNDTVYTVNIATGVATALPNVLGVGISTPLGMASHLTGGDPLLALTPWLSIRKEDNNTLRLIPSTAGYLHEIVAIA